MDVISKFLEKFKNLRVKDKDLKEEIIKVAEEVTHIQIPIKAISIRSGICYLNIQPIERSEIYLHKSQIIQGIQKSFPQLSDIR